MTVLSFELVWEEQILSPCTTLREMSLDEFQSEYEIDLMKNSKWE